jgi:hypothetical protein
VQANALDFGRKLALMNVISHAVLLLLNGLKTHGRQNDDEEEYEQATED